MSTEPAKIGTEGQGSVAQPLRDRLIAGNLVAHVQTMYDGYPSLIMHSDAVAADRAIAVFAAYLREQCDRIDRDFDDADMGYISGYLQRMADELDGADSISPEATP